MSGDVCDGRCGLLGILPVGHSHASAAPAPVQGSDVHDLCPDDGKLCSRTCNDCGLRASVQGVVNEPVDLPDRPSDGYIQTLRDMGADQDTIDRALGLGRKPWLPWAIRRWFW